MRPARAPATTRDLERTKADILQVATEHFRRNGYFGARVDEIAAETASTKRMIYYCFDNKDGLFSACLHDAYAQIRAYEQELHLADLAPTEAIASYVRATIRYHEAHPELAHLVRTENILGAAHIAPEDQPLNRTIINTLDEVLERGRAAGEFRPEVSGTELHIAVTALANFRITNATTIEALFGHQMRAPERLDHDLDQYVAMMLGWLRATGEQSATAAFPRAKDHPARD